MSAFVHQERALAESLGLPQKDLRGVRTDELTVGVDWKNIRGEVCYSDAGRIRLLDALKISDVVAAVDSAPKNSFEPCALDLERAALLGVLSGRAALAPVLAPGACRTLECVRIFPLNRRIVQARRDGQLVRVRVRDSINFIAGMAMPCRLIDGDLWELAQRLPRWKGKW